MEVNNLEKEISIHSNSSIYNNNPSSSPPPPPPPLEGEKTSTPTLDSTHQHIYKLNNNNSHTRDPEPEMIRYRECQRNHAAHLGSRVVDGCGEFMPSGEEGTPLALKCAACDCHRNFHRREVEGETITNTVTGSGNANAQPLSLPPTALKTTNCYISFSKYHKNLVPMRSDGNNNISINTPVQHQYGQHSHPRAPIMMAFGGSGVAAESSSDDLNAYRAGELDCGGQIIEQYGLSKKRFRTKFTQDQKDKMMEFAEKLGWKMQKQNDVEVQRFCSDVGVKRQVFKVWMHNNKQAMKKKQS